MVYFMVSMVYLSLVMVPIFITGMAAHCGGMQLTAAIFATFRMISSRIASASTYGFCAEKKREIKQIVVRVSQNFEEKRFSTEIKIQTKTPGQTPRSPSCQNSSFTFVSCVFEGFCFVRRQGDVEGEGGGVLDFVC